MICQMHAVDCRGERTQSLRHFSCPVRQHPNRSRFWPSRLRIELSSQLVSFMTFLRVVKQIHERQLARSAATFAISRRVQFQILVLHFSVRQMRPLQIFKRRRRTQHKSRRRFAVVFLSERVIDECFQILAKLRQTRFTGVRFVVAKKRNDDVGLDLASAIDRASRSCPTEVVRSAYRR